MFCIYFLKGIIAQGLDVQTLGFDCLDLGFISCVTLSRLPNFCVYQFPIFKLGNDK